MAEQLYIAGEIVTFFYENPQNFYKVVLVKINQTNTTITSEEIVITGTFGQLHQDVHYTFYGDVVSHPKYGQQFAARSYQQEQPTGESGLISYLASERFPGIGVKTAAKIVEKYGLDTIETIIDDETALVGISGLSQKKQRMIREVLIQNQGTEQGIIFLTNLGFSPTIAQKIVQKYKERVQEIISEDPYILLRDVEGIGFKRIDAIAKQLEISPDAACRIQGALFVVVRDLCFQLGHTYLYDQLVVEQTQKLLESTQSYLIEYDQIVVQLNDLIRDGTLIIEENRVSLASIYFAELGVYQFFQKIKHQPQPIKIKQKHLLSAIQKTEEAYRIKYAPKQKDAIISALNAPVFILTGGPGTGKTTVINGLIDVFLQVYRSKEKPSDSVSLKEEILLAAPTGRAAKRMSELTNMPAVTIHRLLGITADDTDSQSVVAFEERGLVGKLLIIDEMSMVDSFLMNRLLKAVPASMQVILVGDSNQLPSVGPGQILADLISSGAVLQIELDRVFRQETHSSIIELAHQVKEGNLPVTFTSSTPDRSFIPCQSAQVQTVVEQIVQKAITKGFSKRDIQVLIPMYKGDAGIDVINRSLQNVLNPIRSKQDRQVEHFDRQFRVGDKVLQLINRAEDQIYNGDIGEIVAIQFASENEDHMDKLVVLFDQIEVEYPRNDWQQLTLAYCCSVHKAQGSEFKLVVLPLVQSYNRMLKRNLLYTGITRSKEFLILCGQERAFQFATEQQAEQRQTVLHHLFHNEGDFVISESLSTKPSLNLDGALKIIKPSSETNKEEDLKVEKESTIFEREALYVLTIEDIENDVIDPLIGMENETPYSI